MKFLFKAGRIFFPFVFLGFAAFSLWGAELADVTASFQSSGLVIKNNTSEDIFYAAHEETLLPLIEWAPICTGENRIPPQKSAQIPAVFKPGVKVHIFWWHKGKHTMDNRHYGPDLVRSFIIKSR